MNCWSFSFHATTGIKIVLVSKKSAPFLFSIVIPNFKIVIKYKNLLQTAHLYKKLGIYLPAT